MRAVISWMAQRGHKARRGQRAERADRAQRGQKEQRGEGEYTDEGCKHCKVSNESALHEHVNDKPRFLGLV